jgi:hypothetical protein
MIKPNFFIVGAPKCGTTALYEYLKEHPNIFLPQLKEPHFFAKEMHEQRSFYTRTANEYFALFNKVTENHIAIGEASVFYIYSFKALEEIRRFNSSAKIIVMLRNPVDMIVSLHSQMVYSLTETRIDFKQAWRANYMPKQRPCPAIETYMQAGQFSVHIKKLFSIFPKCQVKIILLEDLQKSAKDVYEDVLRFLDIPSDHRTYFPKVNENKELRITALGKFTQNPPRLLWIMCRYANNFMGEKLLELVKSVLRVNDIVVKRQPTHPELREEIIEVFSEDIDKLSALIQRDLGYWKSLHTCNRG